MLGTAISVVYSGQEGAVVIMCEDLALLIFHNHNVLLLTEGGVEVDRQAETDELGMDAPSLVDVIGVAGA